MEKRSFVINENMVDANMLNLLRELEDLGYIKDGYLCYELSDKTQIAKVFGKYGKVFLE